MKNADNKRNASRTHPTSYRKLAGDMRQVLPLAAKANEDIAKHAEGEFTLLENRPGEFADGDTVQAYALADVKTDSEVSLFWFGGKNSRGYWAALAAGATQEQIDAIKECVCDIIGLVEKVWNKTAETEDFDSVRQTCECDVTVPDVDCENCTPDGKAPGIYDVTVSGMVNGVDAGGRDFATWANKTHRVIMDELGCFGQSEIESIDGVDCRVSLSIAPGPSYVIQLILGIGDVNPQAWGLGFDAEFNGCKDDPAATSSELIQDSFGNLQYLDDGGSGSISASPGSGGAEQGAAYPPADGEPYALVNDPVGAASLPVVGQQSSGTRRWDQLPTGSAVLWGTADPMLIDGTPRPITGYTNSYQRDYEADPVTGIITIKEEAVLALTGHVTLDQGNNSQNFDMFFGLRIAGAQAGDGDVTVAGLSVTSPQGDIRTVNFNFTRLLRPADPEIGLTLQLLLWTSGSSMGTSTLNVVDFEARERDKADNL